MSSFAIGVPLYGSGTGGHAVTPYRGLPMSQRIAMFGDAAAQSVMYRMGGGL